MEPAELPSTRKLAATIMIALLGAGSLLVTVVLPAEYEMISWSRNCAGVADTVGRQG